MIYNLNGETHWELSREVMEELIDLIDDSFRSQDCTTAPDSRLGIELCNVRAALQGELLRLKPRLDNEDLVS
jgi:hypothetical protein